MPTRQARHKRRAANAADSQIERLMSQHQGLVRKIASGYARCSMPVEDLVSEGNIGLLEALRRFNPGKGAKLSTYATYWIRQAILRALDTKSRTVRLPWQSAAKLKRIETARLELSQERGAEPSDREISERTQIPEKSIKELKASCVSSVSIDAGALSHDSEGATLGERLPDPSCGPDSLLAQKDSRELFRTAIAALDGREAQIIRLRFGLGRHLPESCERVGERMGLSRERVRQIQEQSLLKLKLILAPEFDPARDAIAV